MSVAISRDSSLDSSSRLARFARSPSARRQGEVGVGGQASRERGDAVQDALLPVLGGVGELVGADPSVVRRQAHVHDAEEDRVDGRVPELGSEGDGEVGAGTEAAHSASASASISSSVSFSRI